ncbi:MAG: bile acid:sodium symporter family protein [Microscillaceae bacterium]|jgi:BASS family bile acid:Na+ symporter|nr:bile acid:sodium symporter family protein [Microscillaceae bacterium]
MKPEEIIIHFNQNNLLLLNFCLGFIMFGVALDLKIADFQEIIRNPKSFVVGLVSQIILLPVITFGLVFLFNPHPAFGLGLLLVAACPGGNMSNYISHLAKANIALSVSLTGINTLLAVFTTPFNFTFWASQWAASQAMPKAIALNGWQMVESIAYLLIIPSLLGMFLTRNFPNIVDKIQQSVKVISLLIFVGFIIVASLANWSTFVKYIHYVLILVLIHNGLALFIGYGAGWVAGLPKRDMHTIAIETGIQNAGLGLVLIFNFFDGNGAMALIAGWWGVWHLISGSAIAYYWGTSSKV